MCRSTAIGATSSSAATSRASSPVPRTAASPRAGSPRPLSVLAPRIRGAGSRSTATSCRCGACRRRCSRAPRRSSSTPISFAPSGTTCACSSATSWRRCTRRAAWRVTGSTPRWITRGHGCGPRSRPRRGHWSSMAPTASRPQPNPSRMSPRPRSRRSTTFASRKCRRSTGVVRPTRPHKCGQSSTRWSWSTRHATRSPSPKGSCSRRRGTRTPCSCGCAKLSARSRSTRTSKRSSSA